MSQSPIFHHILEMEEVLKANPDFNSSYLPGDENKIGGAHNFVMESNVFYFIVWKRDHFIKVRKSDLKIVRRRKFCFSS